MIDWPTDWPEGAFTTAAKGKCSGVELGGGIRAANTPIAQSATIAMITIILPISLQYYQAGLYGQMHGRIQTASALMIGLAVVSAIAVPATRSKIAVCFTYEG